MNYSFNSTIMFGDLEVTTYVEFSHIEAEASTWDSPGEVERVEIQSCTALLPNGTDLDLLYSDLAGVLDSDAMAMLELEALTHVANETAEMKLENKLLQRDYPV